MHFCVNPPSGLVVASFEGIENVTTLRCNVTASEIQTTTRWRTKDFRGVTNLQFVHQDFDCYLFLVSGDRDPIGGHKFHNQLTILKLAQWNNTVLWYQCHVYNGYLHKSIYQEHIRTNAGRGRACS